MSVRDSRRSLAGLLLAAGLITLSGLAGPPGAQAQAGRQAQFPNRYIVVLKEEVRDAGLVARQLAQLHGLQIGHIYNTALKGFVATIPQAVLTLVSADARVEFVQPDLAASAAVKGGKKPKKDRGGAVGEQVLPTGVDRIEADLSRTAAIDGADARVGATIAVIDTGIQLDHPDLNVVFNKNFIAPAATGADDNGHGTHVAGIAAALDNGYGVVGAAPGAALWALKVLNSAGGGWNSDVIAAIDYVAAHKDQVDVANLSLGSFFDPAVNRAVERTVDLGVAVTVAAGNDYLYAGFYSPAGAKKAITVSALSDSDGKPGGAGGPTSWGADDEFALFSNWGDVVDVIAPGVDIYSTYMRSGYETLSGTSMAAPHAAGAAALYVARQRTLSGARPAPEETLWAVSASNPDEKVLLWIGDPDGYPEPLPYARWY